MLVRCRYVAVYNINQYYTTDALLNVNFSGYQLMVMFPVDKTKNIVINYHHTLKLANVSFAFLVQDNKPLLCIMVETSNLKCLIRVCD